MVILPDRERRERGSLGNVEMGERVCGSVQEVVVVWMVGVEERMVDEKRVCLGEIMRVFEGEREEGWGGCGEIEETHSSKIG